MVPLRVRARVWACACVHTCQVADGTHSHSRFDGGAIPKTIIIQCSSINSVDMTALQSITKLVARLKRRGIDLLLCSAKWDVRTLLDRAQRAKQKVRATSTNLRHSLANAAATHTNHTLERAVHTKHAHGKHTKHTAHEAGSTHALYPLSLIHI